MSDAVVIGFPKTGTTWLRFLLGAYAREVHGLEAAPLFDDAPSIRRSRHALVPRLRFTHGPLRWEGQIASDLSAANVVLPYRGVRTVLVVRHPIDVLVSHWHHAAERTPRLFDGSLTAFIDDPVFGMDKLLRFHQIWAPRVGGRLVHLVRYEDLRTSPAEGAAAVLRHLGLPVDWRAVSRAVEETSFDAMRRVEEQQPELRYRGGAPVFSPHADAGEPRHVRRGVVGGYRDELDGTVAARLEARVAKELPIVFGYGGR